MGGGGSYSLGFENYNIEVLEWLARSPDMNPIDLWGIIAREVYQNGRQFRTTGEIKSGTA